LRILIISEYFPPLNSIASLRPYSFAKYWSKEGHDVTVLTSKKKTDPTIDLNLPTDKFDVIEALPQKEENKNVSPYSSKKGGKPNPFFSFHLPDITHFWTKNVLKAIESKTPWDLVVSTGVAGDVHVLAEKLKKKGMAKQWIADFRDMGSNTPHPTSFPFNIVEDYIEKKRMQTTDAIVSNTDSYAELIQKKYGVGEVFVIENGFDPTDLEKIPQIPIFLGDKKFRIVHTGSIYPQAQHLERLFEAIHQMSKDTEKSHLLNNLEIIFVGSNLDPVEKMITDFEVSSWVNMLGFVSREVALRMQRDAHAVLFFPCKNAISNGLSSEKIFEYLFSSTPVMAIDQDDTHPSSKLIEDSQIGKTLTNSEQIIDYLESHLLKIKKERVAPTQDVLDKFNRKNLALKMLNIQERI